MSESLTQLNEYLDVIFQYGAGWVYLALFAACFIENIIPPFPGDSFIVVAGGLVALGRLELGPTVAVILAGGVSSVMLMYWFGRHYGRALFLRKNYRFFNADDVNRMEHRLEKWGGLVLISSRFIVGLRSAVAVAAGVAHYYPFRMFVYSLISYIAFVSLLIFLAMELVEHFDTLEQYIHTYNIIVWPLVGLLAGIFIWRRIKRYRRRP